MKPNHFLHKQFEKEKICTFVDTKITNSFMTNNRFHKVMRRVLLTLVALTVPGFLLNAEIVPISTATEVAVNFATELIVSGKSPDISGEATLSSTIGEAAFPLLYIFNIGKYGYILISAEDEVYPVLGWSFSGQFAAEDIPPALAEWIKSYQDQIHYIRDHGLRGEAEVRDAWRHYAVSSSEFTPRLTESADVAPLITAKWNQNSLYNALCPIDMDGPSGRALAGCVATAMGQVMYYYRYPVNGTGSSSYWSSYGMLSANYGATTYRWNEMLNLATPKSHLAIAELLYHIGVSVEMNYGPNASGAYSSNAASALRDYFNYDQSLNLVYKNNYSNTAWANLLKNNLDAGHPMYYHGYGSGGHAFNVDGYQGTNHFHFNWGWGGAYDGYYYLNNLNPGSNSFTNGQGAIVNFKPPATSYPLHCTGSQTITAMAGTIEDGSGPIDEYQNQTECSWLIQPDGLVSRIELSFLKFNTEENNDILYIYDGPDQNAPVLATISGDTIFPIITTTGGEAYIRFVSNASTTAPGWLLNYEAFRPVFCNTVQMFTDPAGTFDDGSGPTNNYNDNTNCKFLIQPYGNNLIILNFSYFSLEDGKDFLKIYDPTTIPSTLLASFTGNTLPQQVVADKGKMLLIFSSDNMNTDLGWEATYTSAVGINEPEKTRMVLFPNPAEDFVLIRLSDNEQISTIRLYDLAGKEVLHIPSQAFSKASEINIDVSILKSGVYILSMDVNHHLYRERLVISR